MNSPSQLKGVNRNYLIRLIRSRPHLFSSFFLGLAVEFFLPETVARQSITRHIFAVNSGAIFYLVLAAQMMFFSDQKKMLRRSELQDEGQVVTLIMSLGAVTTSLIAIIAELSAAKEIHGLLRYEHIALAALTILTSWLFIHLMFALHYAHDY